MMNFLTKIKKYYGWCFFITIGLYLMLNFIYQIGKINVSDVPSSLASTIIMILTSGIALVTIVFIVLKKERFVRLFGYILCAYFFINLIVDGTNSLNVNTTFKLIGNLTQLEAPDALLIITGVVMLIVVLSYISVFVLYLSSLALERKTLNKYSAMTLLITTIIAIIAGSLMIAVYIQNGSLWYGYFGTVKDFMSIPLMILVASIHLFGEDLGINTDINEVNSIDIE